MNTYIYMYLPCVYLDIEVRLGRNLGRTSRADGMLTTSLSYGKHTWVYLDN